MGFEAKGFRVWGLGSTRGDSLVCCAGTEVKLHE